MQGLLPRRGVLALAVLAALAATVALGVACGDDDGGTVSVIGGTEAADPEAESDPTAVAAQTSVDAADATEVPVTLSEWAIEPAVASVPAGHVRFVATNDGSIPHELVIIRSDLAPDDLPVEESRVPEDEVDLIAEIEEFPPGETESGTFTLEPGSYLLICNIAGHYDLGMRVAFTVE